MSSQRSSPGGELLNDPYSNDGSGDGWRVPGGLDPAHGAAAQVADLDVSAEYMTEQPCPTRAPSSRSRLVIAALERQLELVTGGRSVREAFWVCEYDAGMGSGTFGDVQRLENGNTFITYSNRGTIIEVDSAKNILQQFTTDPLGYVVFRESLYGPPPR